MKLLFYCYFIFNFKPFYYYFHAKLSIFLAIFLLFFLNIPQFIDYFTLFYTILFMFSSILNIYVSYCKPILFHASTFQENKIYLNMLFFVSKKPSYNSEKISLKQCSDMFNIGFVYVIAI